MKKIKLPDPFKTRARMEKKENELMETMELLARVVEQEFFSCSSMPRNRELMRVFKDVGLVEQLGSGMSRILKVYDKNIFNISEHFIKVEFPFSVPKEVSPANNNEADYLSHSHLKIKLDLMEYSRVMKYLEIPRSRKEIQSFCGYKSRDSFVKNILHPLIEAEKVGLLFPDKPNSPKQKYYKK